MKEKRFCRIKQYWIWICLLMKRLCRQPVYVILAVMVPLSGYAVGILEGSGNRTAQVAVCAQDGTWSEEIIMLLSEQEADNALQFVFCDDRKEVERLVATKEADCGFVISAQIEEKVRDGAWKKSITAYVTDSSSITGIAKEQLAGVIFRLYSETCYEEYMGRISEEAAAYAVKAYEEHLADDSTFAFRYLYDDSISQTGADTNVGNDITVKPAIFPIKGVFAVLIFVGGMCGMLEYERDRKEQRFLRMAPNALTYLVDIWAPTLFLSTAVALCLWINDGIRFCGGEMTPGRILTVWNFGMWGKQVGNLLIYQGIIILYCMILRIMLRRAETIAAVIPLLALGSLVCAPVFIRLSTYLPVFAVLEKLFPVSYYLLL